MARAGMRGPGVFPLYHCTGSRMSTWHQRRAPVNLRHETEWTVVDDPPNECMSLMTFKTHEEAKAYIERRAVYGIHYCHISPPLVTKL